MILATAYGHGKAMILDRARTLPGSAQYGEISGEYSKYAEALDERNRDSRLPNLWAVILVLTLVKNLTSNPRF